MVFNGTSIRSGRAAVGGLFLCAVAAGGAAGAVGPLPASVKVITREDVKVYGCRTLADALRSTPGIYTTDDRNYTYLGVRGLSRPGDYNACVRLLIDGARANDNISWKFTASGFYYEVQDLITLDYSSGFISFQNLDQASAAEAEAGRAFVPAQTDLKVLTFSRCC